MHSGSFYYQQATLSLGLSSPNPSSAQNILSYVEGKVYFQPCWVLREMAPLEKSQGAMKDFEPLF